MIQEIKQNAPKGSKKLTWKRGEQAIYDGIEGKITFIDHYNGYVRLEAGHWKAQAQIDDLEKVSNLD